MADLNTIKLLIHSLLISSPHPLTVEELRRDYKKTEEQDCPFVALGYTNWLSFLQSLPDVLKVLPNGTCRVVSSKETEHIQHMVALQKKSKRRPLRRPPPIRTNSFATSSYGSYRSASASSYASQRTASASSFGLQRPNISSSFERSMRSDQNQTDMDQFFKAAQEAKTKKRMEERRAAESQESHTADTPRAESPVRNRYIVPDDSDSDSDSLDRFEVVHPLSLNPGPGLGAPNKLSSCRKDSPSYVCDSNYTSFNSNGVENIDVVETNVTEESYDDPFSKSSRKVSDVLKRNLRIILSEHPDGVWACVLPELYQQKFSLSLDWIELGYNSVCQMAHDLPDVFICKRIKSGDWRLFDARRPLPVAYMDEPSSSEAQTVPGTVRKKIRSLAKMYPSGVSGMDFAQLYREKYNRSLLMEAPCFKNIEELLHFLQDSDIHIRYVLKECYVYPSLDETEPDEAPLSSLDPKMIQELGLYPEEVFGPEDKYPDTELPADLEEGSYVELIVAEVYHPQKFWVQFRKMQPKLDKMMDELNDFYAHHGEKYKMPSSTIRCGQCCVAMYSNEWHRASISAVYETEVEVFYVDYGTLIKRPKQELRFLHKDFRPLPKQAVRASLFGIQPPKGRKRFSNEANKAFLQLVSEKPLVGLAHKVDFDEPSLQVFLIDTSGSSDVHLNDVLVNQKHADFLSELLDGEESVEQNCHDPPSVEVNVSETSKPSPPKPQSSSPQKPQVSSNHSEPPQVWTGSRSYLPPPGFNPKDMYNDAGSRMGNVSGVGPFSSGLTVPTSNVAGITPSVANLNPLAANLNPLGTNLNPLNPAFAAAAYSQAFAFQQQQQAWYQNFNFCQNFLQQNVGGGYLNPHQKPVNAVGNQNHLQQNMAAGYFNPHQMPANLMGNQNLLQQNMGASYLNPQQMSANLLLNQKLLQQNMGTGYLNPPQTPANVMGNQNYLQQSMSANYLNAQQKPSTVVENPYKGNPIMYPQPTVQGDKTYSSIKTLAETDLKLSDSSVMCPESFTGRTNQNSMAESRENKSEYISSVTPSKSTTQEKNCFGSKMNVQRNKVSPLEKSTFNAPELTDISSENKSLNNNNLNVLITKPLIKTNALNALQSSLNEKDETVDCWEELADKSCTEEKILSNNSSMVLETSSSTSEESNLADKLEDFKLSNLNHPPSETSVNFWKEIDMDGKKMHLFNIENKGFVSTNELAKQFTSFSNSSSIVRVLEAKGINVPFLKLSRPQNLPLFSALDGCLDYVVSELGLTRNKNGNVIGILHLTPISNIPSMLVILGVLEDSLIEEFQTLRENFSRDPFWK